jgi:tetratricopeptide (TPR) repeat protein
MMHASSCVRARVITTRAQAINSPQSDVASTRVVAPPALYRRRAAMLTLGIIGITSGVRPSIATEVDDVFERAVALQSKLVAAYDVQDFSQALATLHELRELEPTRLAWIEGEATVSVDAKKFKDAIKCYGEALSATSDAGDLARLYAGRALAHEGLYLFEDALRDYDAALRLCVEGGFAPDPYILNSRGNVRGSLGDWAGAKEDYADSAGLFQGAKGLRRGASTTQRLDAAIYSASNAALADVQLGNVDDALKKIEGLVRRAPNSADMRAAMAVLYYDIGRFEDAEDAWERACSREAGCAKYKDIDYVQRIRRWPPVMVTKLKAFLDVKQL